MKRISALALGFLLLISIPALAANLAIVGPHIAEWDYEAGCANFILYWSTSSPPVWDKARSASIPQPSAGTIPAYDLSQSLSTPGTYWIAVTCFDGSLESDYSNIVPFCLDHSLSADTEVFSGYAGTCPCLTFIAAPIGGNTDKIGTAGGTQLARVLNGAGCKWTASSLSSWITIDPNFLTGVGDGWTQYIVQPNTTGAQRKGIVSANGKYLVITQSK